MLNIIKPCAIRATIRRTGYVNKRFFMSFSYQTPRTLFRSCNNNNAYHQSKYIRSFNTGVKKTKQLSLPSRALGFLNRPAIRYTIRIGRMGFLIVGIAGAAYAYGQMELLNDPEGHQSAMFYATVCQEGLTKHFVSFWDSDNLKGLAFHMDVSAYCYEIDYKNPGKYLRKQINEKASIWQCSLKAQKVFKRVKSGALSLFEDRVKDLEKKLSETPLSDTFDRSSIMEELNDAKVKRNSLRKPWNLVMLSNGSPNAFVHGFLPQKIFIHDSAMYYFAQNEDELALLLGHELTHYLENHSREQVQLTFMTKGIVMVLLSLIDPTGGVSGFALELFLPYIDNFITAANSREHEHEADRIGLEIVARSCYNPTKAMKLFTNMKNFEIQYKSTTANLTTKATLNMLNSHPLSVEREKDAEIRAEEVGSLYMKNCSEIRKKAWGSLFK